MINAKIMFVSSVCRLSRAKALYKENCGTIQELHLFAHAQDQLKNKKLMSVFSVTCSSSYKWLCFNGAEI